VTRLTVVARWLALGSSLWGCVVTTLEGPGDPPRVVPPPDQPNRAAALEAETRAPEPTPTIGARHLLVAYAGAMRASPDITRTKDEARARALQAFDRARAGEPFEKHVAE
jgi:hypothetical protein